MRQTRRRPTCTHPALLLALLAACEADPVPGNPTARPPVNTGFVGGSLLRLGRDDYRPTGWYHDVDGLALRSVGARLRHGARTWPASLELRWMSGNEASFAFALTPERRSIPIEPGRDNLLELVLLPDPAGGPERVVARTSVSLAPGVLVIPVVTWNLGGAVPGVDRQAMQYLLDRADDLHPPDGVGPSAWARQRVDAVWAPCGIQFRLVDHHDGDLPGDCWRSLVVSNQSTLVPRCSTLRAACTAGDPEVQDFTDCSQQDQNRCSLLDLVRVAAEDPAYDGPAVFQRGAVNVYFAERFHLYEDLAMGIGCAGEYPLIALSDMWPDASGLRLAHELGHVMGIGEHVSGTVMGDEDDRTEQVTVDLCDRSRAHVASHYGFVP